jgi:Ni/Co efflux regulator RcnB
MRNHVWVMSRLLTFGVAAILAAGPVAADKPAWAGSGKKQEEGERGAKGKGKGQGKGQQRDARVSAQGSQHFVDRQRVVVREYYVTEHRGGRCPPGLAKKQNGCMPPGQAKKWRVGYPLPRDVVFYDLPPTLVVELGPPPAGHRFVRVAADILLIAVGTGMVIDAITDLGRL